MHYSLDGYNTPIQAIHASLSITSLIQHQYTAYDQYTAHNTTIPYS